MDEYLGLPSQLFLADDHHHLAAGRIFHGHDFFGD